jgi:hypothetical protein
MARPRKAQHEHRNIKRIASNTALDPKYFIKSASGGHRDPWPTCLPRYLRSIVESQVPGSLHLIPLENATHNSRNRSSALRARSFALRLLQKTTDKIAAPCHLACPPLVLRA